MLVGKPSQWLITHLEYWPITWSLVYSRIKTASSTPVFPANIISGWRAIPVPLVNVPSIILVAYRLPSLVLGIFMALDDLSGIFDGDKQLSVEPQSQLHGLRPSEDSSPSTKSNSRRGQHHIQTKSPSQHQKLCQYLIHLRSQLLVGPNWFCQSLSKLLQYLITVVYLIILYCMLWLSVACSRPILLLLRVYNN